MVSVSVRVMFNLRFRYSVRVSVKDRVRVRVRKKSICMNFMKCFCVKHTCVSLMIHCCWRYVQV